MDGSQIYATNQAMWLGTELYHANFQAQPLGQNGPHQDYGDSTVDGEIVKLLPCASPKTKESILHLLRNSTRAGKNSGAKIELLVHWNNY